MAVSIMKQIVITDALLEIGKVRKQCLEVCSGLKIVECSFIYIALHFGLGKEKINVSEQYTYSVIYTIDTNSKKKLKVPSSIRKCPTNFHCLITKQLIQICRGLNGRQKYELVSKSMNYTVS